MRALLSALAFAAGFGLTIQVGMNAALRSAFGNVILATLANFLVGIAVLVAYLLVTRPALPDRAMLAGAPAWAWLGGLLGALYVAASTIVGPRLGAVALLALVLAGQMLASVLVDHFGWLGFPQQPLTLAKLAGLVLLLIGAWLIIR